MAIGGSSGDGADGNTYSVDLAMPPAGSASGSALVHGHISAGNDQCLANRRA